ncbi:hypothetical protein BH11ARM2_BH11ARM2_17580 [soil metagenome]
MNGETVLSVFHDLGLPDADELVAKSRLMMTISGVIREKGWSRAELSRLTGIDSPELDFLLNERITEFTPDCLMQILTKLDQDVVITIAPRPVAEKRSARITVQQAQALGPGLSTR